VPGRCRIRHRQASMRRLQRSLGCLRASDPEDDLKQACLDLNLPGKGPEPASRSGRVRSGYRWRLRGGLRCDGAGLADSASPPRRFSLVVAANAGTSILSHGCKDQATSLPSCRCRSKSDICCGRFDSSDAVHPSANQEGSCGTQQWRRPLWRAGCFALRPRAQAGR
jgi:hypothetical protein